MSTDTRHNLEGRCLCGAVHLRVQADSLHAGACHCGICRKWGGGPLLAVECGTNVHIQGDEHVTTYDTSDWAERGFCRHCGTHLFYRLRQGGFHAIPLGLLDGDPAWQLDHEVFIDDKPAYYDFANATKKLTGAEVFAQFGAE